MSHAIAFRMIKPLAFALLFFAAAGLTLASSIEVRCGVLVHDVAPLWGNTKVEGGFDLNAEIIFGGARILRPCVGASINSQGDTSRVYGGLLADFDFSLAYFSLFFGAAAHVNSTRKLGSTVLFRIAGEVGHRWGPHSLGVMFAHISNGDFFFRWGIENAGMDVLGIRYGFTY